jgi:hypothetical protein
MLRILTPLFFFCFILTYGHTKSLRIGVEQLHVYLSKLTDKQIGIVINRTAVVGNAHLLDQG